jgi:lipoprotein-releasing system permease protein
MNFALKVAWRYLKASKFQTTLLVLGGSLGVMVFLVLAMLVQGLSNYLIDSVTESIPHITILPRESYSTVFYPADEGTVLQSAVPISSNVRPKIQNIEYLLSLARAQPEVKAALPRVSGSVFVVRGQNRTSLQVEGVDPEEVNLLYPIEKNMKEGSSDLSRGGLIIGDELAKELDLRLGNLVLLQTDRGAKRTIRIDGIIDNETLDLEVNLVSLTIARSLFDMRSGADNLALKLHDPNDSTKVASRLRDVMPFKVKTWQQDSQELGQIIAGQKLQTTIIQALMMTSVLIGISSALLLTTYRRRSEIGVMRSFGMTQKFVASIFVFQGALLGLMSSLVGCAQAWLILTSLAHLGGDGGDFFLPISHNGHTYALSVVFTVFGAMLAAVVPARSAARVDPVEVLGN